MFLNAPNVKTTSYKVVIPFYIYAAIAFLASAVLLLISNEAFTIHYFHNHILGITHMMALGWGTMIIMGAGHQLIPVLIEGKLYSNKLAYVTFTLTAIGIPMLIHGFYSFNFGDIAKWGGRLVWLGITCFIINVFLSIKVSKGKNVHVAYVIASLLWLFATAFFGLVLVYNFTAHFLESNPMHYVPLHAHAGIIGWFLLLVIGMAARLIPMFMISKYTNPKVLWYIFYSINAGLILYIINFYVWNAKWLIFVSIALMLAAVVLFLYFCYQAYKHRLRKAVDEQVKLSILSVVMMFIPIAVLSLVISLLITLSQENKDLILTYGFMIFFGWITAIILGMTFKTLPFIVWNKVYRKRSELGKPPSPKDMFDHTVFNIMGIAYLLGFVLFATGIIISLPILLKSGASLLIITAILYNFNVIKVIIHKPKIT